MALNHTHQAYPNYVLANEIEDQLNTKLDLLRFCTIDNSLVGVAGDTKKIRVYNATSAVEKLAMGDGNTKNIEVAYSDVEYKIGLSQVRFPYYDEELMVDPLVIQTGVKYMSTDLVNNQNDEVIAEFAKATLTVNASAFDFGAFVDASALLNSENIEGEEIFCLVNPADVAAIRKTLKDDLKYVESFVKQGYVGHVAGMSINVSKLVPAGTIYGGLKSAVTLFRKKGTEVEQERDANIRLNKIYARNYYLAALTDATKAFKIVKGA